MTQITAKKVWTNEGWIENACVAIENGRIQSVQPITAQTYDYPLLVPGYIEQHIHGGHFYCVENPDAEAGAQWLQEEAKHGVAALYPSPSTHAVSIMKRGTEIFSEYMKHRVEKGAAVLGIHLEGPFVNPVRKGGMEEESILPPSIEALQEIAGQYLDQIKLVSLAPEMDGADELLQFLVSHHIKINAGHSDATAEQMKHAIECGVDGITHFFNATRPIHHREPGLLAIGMMNPSVYCEMIGDLVHLSPDTIRFLVQMVGPSRICLITDAIEYTGVEDGIYGDKQVVNGSPRLMDGTLLGSRYLMDKVVQSLIGIGLDPFDVFRMASWTPAQRMGEKDLGNLAPGYRAMITALDEKYNVKNTFIDGKPIFD